MNEELFKALADLEKEKGIPMDFMLDRLKAALTAAYRRDNPDGGEVDFVMDKAARQMRMFALKTVVEEVENPNAEVTAAEAESITGKPAAIGDVVRFELDTRSFGRIAAQTAKQVIIQGIRESERDALYEEYSAKTNEILTALVTKNDRRTGIVYLTLKGGRGEEQSLILPPSEQIKGEEIREGEYLKVYLIGVQMGAKGTQIQISRTHSGLVKRLFEMEVPEIYDGVVDIVSIAREPGSRTKIAVSSNDRNVDPIGACVGPRGQRVNAVVDELKGEKIDIVKYSDDPREFVAAALAPAEVLSVSEPDEDKACRVIVPDDHLSLAIGREGQNARLAARLTGYKIDIKPLSSVEA
jgi:N utilization substance protein A